MKKSCKIFLANLDFFAHLFRRMCFGAKLKKMRHHSLLLPVCTIERLHFFLFGFEKAPMSV